MERNFRPAGIAAVAAVISCTALAACSAISSTTSSSSSTSTTAAAANAAAASASAATVPTAVPSGVTLRVADQESTLENELAVAGENTNVPYKVVYSEFAGGAAEVQAFQASSVDVGMVADTPLIFAQAAKVPIVGVAAWAPENGDASLVSAPGEKISGWAGLKGKKVAFTEGTVMEAAVLEGLASAGLSLKDITPVNLATTSITPALENGSVDAAILLGPQINAYLAVKPTATVVATESDITTRVDFLVSTNSALANSGEEAAIADYISRLAKAQAWINAHPAAWAEAVYVKEYKMSLAAGEKLTAATGPVTFLPLPGKVGGAQQTLADLYTSASAIPGSVNTSTEFDGRFNSFITADQ